MTAASEGPEAFRLLFVCTGNTCRSPLAEALARAEARTRGWTHVEVSSAGVSTVAGLEISEGSLRVAERHGLDVSEHRSRPLTPELAEWADLILVMSDSHLVRVSELGGAGRAAILDTFVHGEDGGGVPDPFGQSDEVYEETYRALEALVRAAFDRLEPILAP
jgi:protein-tyrosine-phosphatase